MAATRQAPTVTSHEIRDQATRLFCLAMGDPPRTPDPGSVPERLLELLPDVRAAVLMGEDGALASGTREGLADPSDELPGLVGELLQAVDAAANGSAVEELEAQTDRALVFAVRRAPWTLAAVARRSALPSLVRFDMRALLAELEGAAP